jgi:nicotinate-nucleotide pyrophosphorylase (carboxylating)
MRDEIFWKEIDFLIEGALLEDFGKAGDITTQAAVPGNRRGKGELIAKEAGLIAGLSVFQRVLYKVDPEIRLSFSVQDGDRIKKGTIVGTVNGSIASILKAERTALNFLQHLSGIATYTNQFVQVVKGTKAKITDTRKTTPLLRLLEKYAVRVGGGENHRLGLYDMMLIKNNHVDVCGGITQAVRQCLDYCDRKNLQVLIEVETRTIRELKEAMRFPVHRIMLDNMSLDTMKRAVEMVQDRIPLEASGNISLDNIRDVAETGVDYISIGALTHSVRALDLSLRLLVRNK